MKHPYEDLPLNHGLLAVIKLWDVVKLENKPLFHGARTSDVGIDASNNAISGNKWFTDCGRYALGYTSHGSRKAEGDPIRLQATLKKEVFVIRRPDSLPSMPEFLREHFKLQGYDNSTAFTHALGKHLQVAFDGKVHGYMWEQTDGSEILLPHCEELVVGVDMIKVPANRMNQERLFSSQGLYFNLDNPESRKLSQAMQKFRVESNQLIDNPVEKAHAALRVVEVLEGVGRRMGDDNLNSAQSRMIADMADQHDRALAASMRQSPAPESGIGQSVT